MEQGFQPCIYWRKGFAASAAEVLSRLMGSPSCANLNAGLKGLRHPTPVVAFWTEMILTACSFPRSRFFFCLLASLAPGFFICLIAALPAAAQQPLIIERSGETIVLEPYATNIVRVTLSLQKDQATAAPGFGFVGAPSFKDWARTHGNGDDVYSSPRMVVTV